MAHGGNRGEERGGTGDKISAWFQSILVLVNKELHEQQTRAACTWVLSQLPCFRVAKRSRNTLSHARSHCTPLVRKMADLSARMAAKRKQKAATSKEYAETQNVNSESVSTVLGAAARLIDRSREPAQFVRDMLTDAQIKGHKACRVPFIQQVRECSSRQFCHQRHRL